MRFINQRFFKPLLAAVLFMAAAAMAQNTGSISGTVNDAKGEPLIGANVLVKGTALGAASAQNGAYSVFSVPPGEYTVTASFIGYKSNSQTVTVGAGATATAAFVLVEDVLGLSEVVVTGVVNPASKIESSVSISTLNTRDFEKSAPRTTAEIFRSIPGIRSEASGGDGNTNITVRGVPISAGGSTARFSVWRYCICHRGYFFES
jgi:hypothetical protein